MKEGKTRRRAVTRTVVVGGVLISAAAIALITPWLGVFGLRQISVSGNRRVSAEAIGRTAGLDRDQSLLTVSLSAVSTRVATLPWIKQVSVTRKLPHTLSIRVVERAPVAWIRLPDDSGCLTIGEGGVLVASNCDSRDATFQLLGAALSGDALGSRLVDERVADLIDVLHAAPPPSVNIERIDVSDPSSIVLDEASGLRILLGSIDLFARRVEALAAMSRSIDVGKYALIDLRLEGEARLVTW